MRARLALALVVAGIGVAAVVDARIATPRAPSPVVTPVSDAGLLACPFATEPRARAYLHLANLGRGTSRYHVTLVPAKGRRVRFVGTLEEGRARTVALHPKLQGASAAIIEHAGGGLSVSHSLWMRGGGVAAAACARAGPAVTVLPHGRTLSAETRIAVVNPGAADAEISIALLAARRRLDPEHLTRRVVPARSRREFRIGDFAFDAREVTAHVRAETGRVVAETLVRSAGGTTLYTAQEGARDAVAIAGSSREGTALGLATVGEDDAGVEARAFGTRRRGRATGVPPSVAPEDAVRVSIRDRSGAAVAYGLPVTVGSPVGASTSWVVRRGDATEIAGTEGMSPAREWAGVIGTLERAGTARVLLVNPHEVPVRVRLRVVSQRGPQARDRTIERTLRPASVRAELLSRGSGTHGVLVTADAPVATILDVLTRPSGGIGGFAVTPSPVRPLDPVPSAVDPRAGVPALRRRD